jgi:NAD(P)-dependent dehydrogenase (short-subunit alcohol dehydrogenase family)
MSVVIVTGAGSGIGRAAAVLFGADGAQVVCADIDEAAAGETAKIVTADGGDAIGVRVDVADDPSVGAMVAAAIEQFGRLDAAFNNAGISPAPKPFTEHTLAEWQRVIDVNLTGVFLCMQHEIRQFVAQGDGGAIVNMSSGAGVVAAPGQPQYTAAKHGVLGLTKQAAQEYMRQGIRVNAILPGMTDTPPMRDYLAGNDGMVRMLPGGRLAEPEEIARAAVWLCSAHASYVSGASLVVDGGLISR